MTKDRSYAPESLILLTTCDSQATVALIKDHKMCDSRTILLANLFALMRVFILVLLRSEALLICETHYDTDSL